MEVGVNGTVVDVKVGDCVAVKVGNTEVGDAVGVAVNGAGVGVKVGATVSQGSVPTYVPFIPPAQAGELGCK